MPRPLLTGEDLYNVYMSCRALGFEESTDWEKYATLPPQAREFWKEAAARCVNVMSSRMGGCLVEWMRNLKEPDGR